MFLINTGRGRGVFATCLVLMASALPTSVRAAQTINTTTTTSCSAQGGTPSGVNLITDFDNGTFGSENGNPDQSPSVDPYPSQVVGGIFSNFYAIAWGYYSYVANAQTPRNPYQHPDITDPVYGATGRFFASDPNTNTPTMNFTITNVTPDENYELSFWAANSEPNGTPNIVNAVVDNIVSYSTGNLIAYPSALEWKKHSFVFNAGNRTTIQLSMASTETGSGGRDFYIDNVEMQGCTLVTAGGISGTVFTDVDTDDIYTNGLDGKLSSISVQLWDTQGDGDPSNDIFVSTTSSDANGLYEFSNLPALTTYELRVDTTDTDLPAGATSGTADTLSVTVTSGTTLTDQNFGFDMAPSNLTAFKTVEVYDPLAEGLYAIPGNDVIYTIKVVNTGASATTKNTIFLVDQLPSDIEFYNGDMDDAGTLTTDPIAFSQTGAGLSYSYADRIAYAAVGVKPANFAACNYTPSVGYDANVGYVCFKPKGKMSAGTPDPEFEISFRARIK